jgi:class 3 adenylate cyclase
LTKNTDNISPQSETRGVRKILLSGVFWRILVIEAILLVWSVAYRALTAFQGADDLFWYAVRIIILIAIIIAFMMVTLRRFLQTQIIQPLETIALSNRLLKEDDPQSRHVNLSDNSPREIKEIVVTRDQMLNDIIKVSQERLRLMNFVRDTFGRYVSKEVVDQILESPEGRKIGGRKATVTVLFSDLRGFTGLSETQDPETMVQLLNRYLERMSEIILKYDGIIDEFIGDGILAIFGVPESRRDDPERAVACALAMQNALNQLNPDIVSQGYPELEMGIGINTGEVIVGNIGSEMRLKYGIVGSAVNIASRIESNTVGGQVMIGASTYRQVQALVKAEAPQTVMMKGLKQPLVMYSITAIGEPYNIRSEISHMHEQGVPMTLPFHYWNVYAKKVEEPALNGETVCLSANTIFAVLDRPAEKLGEIKLQFNFCTEAHCFEAVYAKVTDIISDPKKTVYQLRITFIQPDDKAMLKQWMQDASV